MKRKERHHLKHNPVADFVASAQRYLEVHSRRITTVIMIVLVAAVGLVAILFVQRQTASRADALLAEALVALNAEVLPTGTVGQSNVPAAAQFGAEGTFATEEAKLKAALPKLETAATTYPNTEAAVVARYHMAAALAALGRFDDAIAAFDEVQQRAGERSLYGRMARLGRADTLLQAERYDDAIASWKQIAEESGDTPTAAALMGLARAYAAKGDTEEARRTLSTIVDEHSDSVYSTEARARLDSLPG